MRNRAACFTCAALAAVILLPISRAQNDSKTPGNSKQKGPTTTPIPDFSGYWGPGPKGPIGGWDLPSLPMTAWGAARYNAARPPFGPKATFEAVNDPVQLYCDPPGIPRIYPYPWEFTVLQTKDVVYMLFEFTRTWRSIAMDRDHPADPDQTWLGDSVGKYEGDTLVIDTVGFNDKTWLDQTGNPHSDALHLIERVRLADHDTLEVAMTVEDSKAYTKPFTGKRMFKRTTSAMGETICSVSEMQSFQKEIMEPTTTKSPK